MVNLTVGARGPLSADAVWERYARPALWPSWSPQIRRVECPSERLAGGVRGRVIGPLGLAVPFTVDEWDELRRRWSWTVRLGPARLRLEHGVAAHDGGTATYVRIDGPAPIVLPYLPLARFALHRLVHCSSGTTLR